MFSPHKGVENTDERGAGERRAPDQGGPAEQVRRHDPHQLLHRHTGLLLRKQLRRERLRRVPPGQKVRDWFLSDE